MQHMHHFSHTHFSFSNVKHPRGKIPPLDNLPPHARHPQCAQDTNISHTDFVAVRSPLSHISYPHFSYVEIHILSHPSGHDFQPDTAYSPNPLHNHDSVCVSVGIFLH